IRRTGRTGSAPSWPASWDERPGLHQGFATAERGRSCGGEIRSWSVRVVALLIFSSSMSRESAPHAGGQLEILRSVYLTSELQSLIRISFSFFFFFLLFF